MKRSILSILIAGLLVAACGGSTPPPATPESSSASSSGEGTSSAAAAPDAWRDDMSQADKAAFMKAHVVPGMAPVFQAYDAAKYADFGCATCHGPEGKLPTAFLPKLTFKNNQLLAFAEQPELSKFMAEKVSPQMASILGKAPYDPATHQGFGCPGCHIIDVK